ncbi:PPE family protein [Mycobacterium vicinigordonae]|uniref:PPE family protein n=1 Tax=Mycobacterium vicinigordonae TaxID=1719132 RepID=A0A7D6IQS5_9MYCO|nr:PPE family protein [Mycobacterium vicinigordonae]QLL09680.1 PPE family protein [Mycobacterium vicinigordonae]
MLDFGALSPEVNSSRMYAGPGSLPLMASASAWQALAGQLESVRRGYTATISELEGQAWSGDASASMAGAVQPYLDWIAETAAQADEAATRARAAIAAYEAAFTATVPPAVVAANRAQYQALVRANLFGQYTAAVAAIESDYAEMWAQDAQAMYGYARASSAATALTPFTEPPQTTSAAAQANQGAALAAVAASTSASNSQSTLAQLVNVIPRELGSLAGVSSTSSSSSLLSTVSEFNTLSSPSNLGAGFARTIFSGASFLAGAYRSLLQAKDLPQIASEDAAAAAAAGRGAVKAAALAPAGSVIAGAGRAAPIGGLSVPPSWASSAPVASVVEEPHWLSEAELSATPAGLSHTPGAGPMMGTSASGSRWGHATVNNVLRVPSRGFKMPRPVLGG